MALEVSAAGGCHQNRAGLPQSGQLEAMSASTHEEPEAEPQGNAMLSVRVAAAGAVASVFASFLTVPASACDFDRYQKKCDRELAAREQSESAPVAQRRSAKRARITQAQRARAARADRKTRSAPRFATRRGDGFKLSSSDARTVSLPETAMSRRFRGFIDPRPVGDNAFESMRKPHLNAHDFHGAMIVPVQVALITTSDAPAPVATTAKQNRIAVAAPAPAVAPAIAQAASVAAPAATPAATMTLASAESKPVVLPPLASKPAAAPPVAPPAVMQASVLEAPGGPSRFSIHALVLALCGALGAASALRFIVGA
jgi:hypothetical protein